MGTGAIFEILYASVAAAPFSTAQLRALLSSARAKNAGLDVTGLLLHGRGAFLQILEGPEGHVRALFDAICRDPRHVRVSALTSAPRRGRSFAAWTMGFADTDSDERVPGFNDFLKKGFTDTGYTPELRRHARELALRFRHDSLGRLAGDP